MCTTEFREALIPDVGAGPVSDPFNRPNRTGAAAREAPPGGRWGLIARRGHEGAATESDERILRRAGLSRKEAKQLARFANTRGGLDAFDNIQAARAAFSRSGAFTDRALQPREVKKVSRISSATPNQNRVGAVELIGLPLIRTRG